MMSPFTQYKQWMIDRYGDALFRVPVQLATSCPHGRCTFCSENGAKAQQTQQAKSLPEQIEAAVKFSRRRYKAQKLMLYVQAFTADLTDPVQQEQIFQSLEAYNFEAISIGTRPDCLPETAYRFLEMLKEKVEVWVELGVQTANDETLRRINRGHDWASSKQAIHALAQRGIHVAPHVIIGLPGETVVDWRHTAEELAKLPISGIKIHNLHIMKGSALADKPPPVLSHWDYAEALMDFLRRIPLDIPVMRISTDTPEEELIAPKWCLEKGQFLDYVTQQMTCRQIRQGDLTESRISNPEPRMEPVITDDGSITFFSPDWKEHYHTRHGARLEAQQKFVIPSGLSRKLQTSDIKLLDVCFGLGNNSLAALCAAAEAAHRLEITALEMDKRIVLAASQQFKPLETDPVNWRTVLKELCTDVPCHLPPATLSLLWGDARYLIQTLEHQLFDLIYHDPFSSQHCPELWTVEFFQQLYRVLRQDGVLLTYASALPVRGALREAGFIIGETHPGNRMGNGTIAARSADALGGFPLLDIPENRRSTPYRDPHLCATAKAILRQRQESVESAMPGL